MCQRFEKTCYPLIPSDNEQMTRIGKCKTTTNNNNNDKPFHTDERNDLIRRRKNLVGMIVPAQHKEIGGNSIEWPQLMKVRGILSIGIE